MKVLRRIFALFICFTIVLSTFTLVYGKSVKKLSGEITFWHFNDDEANMLARAFEKVNPGVIVKEEITTDIVGNYQIKFKLHQEWDSYPMYMQQKMYL